MSTLIAWLAVLAYVLVGTFSGGIGARWLADRWARCHDTGTFRSVCQQYHADDCWRPDGELSLSIIATSTGAALVWPLAILPAAIYAIASRRPSPVLNAQRIAELEYELGLERKGAWRP